MLQDEQGCSGMVLAGQGCCGPFRDTEGRAEPGPREGSSDLRSRAWQGSSGSFVLHIRKPRGRSTSHILPEIHFTTFNPPTELSANAKNHLSEFPNAVLSSVTQELLVSLAESHSDVAFLSSP